MSVCWSGNWNFTRCRHKHNAFAHTVGQAIFAYRNEKGEILFSTNFERSKSLNINFFEYLFIEFSYYLYDSLRVFDNYITAKNRPGLFARDTRKQSLLPSCGLYAGQNGPSGRENGPIQTPCRGRL